MQNLPPAALPVNLIEAEWFLDENDVCECNIFKQFYFSTIHSVCDGFHTDKLFVFTRNCGVVKNMKKGRKFLWKK